jgi:transposase
MSKELVSDEFWEIIEPLLVPVPPKPKGGRPRLDDRTALTGIVFVSKSGIQWEMLSNGQRGQDAGTRNARLALVARKTMEAQATAPLSTSAGCCTGAHLTQAAERIELGHQVDKTFETATLPLSGR